MMIRQGQQRMYHEINRTCLGTVCIVPRRSIDRGMQDGLILPGETTQNTSEIAKRPSLGVHGTALQTPTQQKCGGGISLAGSLEHRNCRSLPLTARAHPPPYVDVRKRRCIDRPAPGVRAVSASNGRANGSN
jgi:hypothetical protein